MVYSNAQVYQGKKDFCRMIPKCVQVKCKKKNQLSWRTGEMYQKH